MNLSLRQRVNGAIVITYLMIAMLFLAIQVPFQRFQVEKAVSSSEMLLETLVERDAEQLANEIFDDRLRAIELRIAEMGRTEGVLGIAVFDLGGARLAATGLEGTLRASLTAGEIARIGENSQIAREDTDAGEVLLLSKNLGFLGEQLGFIQVSYSMSEIHDFQRRALLLLGVVLGAILVVMLVVLNLILSRTVLGPLLDLEEATQVMLRGNLETEIQLHRSDELGSLAASFEEMRLSIRNRVADLQRVTNIIESTSDLVYVADLEGRIIYANKAGRVLLDQHEVGSSPSVRMREIYPEWVAKMLDEVGIPEAREKGTWSGEAALLDASGSEIPVSQVVIAHEGDRGEVEFVSTILRDLSERERAKREKKTLEEQLRQSQKMEAIGRLAGGIAHDLNNLLVPIIGYSELLLRTEDDRLHESLGRILQAGFQAQDLVEQILTFSRKRPLRVRRFDLREIVSESYRLLVRTIREDVEVDIRASNEPLLVMADRGQLQQVITNLAVNASDAMPEGGILTIAMSQAELDEGYAARHRGVSVGSYALLEVTDNGCGMDPSTQAKIFEPFFSTKGHKGTGLGLATVYGIVKQHGGHIWVYSEPGQGATFKVYFPLDSGAAVDDRPEASIPAEGLRGTETILLVEDSAEVRDLVETVLEKSGYHVLSTGSAEQALRLHAEQEGSLDLLLTDVVMPDLDGRTLFERMRKEQEDLKVLYMSGYSENVVSRHGVLDDDVELIQKPFASSDLLRRVRQVIEGSRHPASDE